MAIRGTLLIAMLAAFVPASRAAEHQIQTSQDRTLPDQLSAAKTVDEGPAGLTIHSIDARHEKLWLGPSTRHVIRGRGLDKVRVIELASNGTRSRVHIVSQSDTRLIFQMRTKLSDPDFPTWKELKDPFNLEVMAQYEDSNGLINSINVAFPETTFALHRLQIPPSPMRCDPLPCKKPL